MIYEDVSIVQSDHKPTYNCVGIPVGTSNEATKYPIFRGSPPLTLLRLSENGILKSLLVSHGFPSWKRPCWSVLGTNAYPHLAQPFLAPASSASSGSLWGSVSLRAEQGTKLKTMYAMMLTLTSRVLPHDHEVVLGLQWAAMSCNGYSMLCLPTVQKCLDKNAESGGKWRCIGKEYSSRR